jgi:hypothetical protein
MVNGSLPEIRTQLLNERQTRAQLEETLRVVRRENAQLRSQTGLDGYHVVYIPKLRTIQERVMRYVRSFRSLDDVKVRFLSSSKTVLQFVAHFLNEFVELLWPVEGAPEGDEGVATEQRRARKNE